ncbi:MAG: PAS domain S-box protein [Sulfuricellaceae bacterium]|nr:PAS domain S-box protein [Sulfuricellaceae bacterium]
MTKLAAPPLIFHSIAWMAAAALLVAALGYAAFDYQKQEIKQKNENNLAEIANLKAGQISAWMEERRGNATIMTRSPLVPLAEKWFQEGAPEGPTRELMLAPLEAMQRVYHYDTLMLLDDRGVVRLSTKGKVSHQDDHQSELALEAMRSRQVVMSDIHLGERGKPELDFVAPLLSGTGDEARVAGAVYFNIDPEKFLFPLIQAWPIDSETAETLLVRQEHGKVVYLNELRHRANTALTLSFPLDMISLPAVQAIKGETGFVSAADYRGKQVVAYVRQVEGTPWAMVAKIDEAEIYHPIQKLALYVSLMVAGLLAAIILAILLRRSQASAAARHSRDEEEKGGLQQRFNFLSQFASDIILLLDERDRIIDANERAIEAYGYSREELLALRGEELCDETMAGCFAQEWQQLQAHDHITMETVHQRKDGAIFQVEKRARLVEIGGQPFVQAVLRDISERKQTEARLSLSEERLRTLFASIRDAIFVHGMTTNGKPGRFVEVNEVACQRLGYSQEELLEMTPMEIDAPESGIDLRPVIEQLNAGQSVIFEQVHLARNGRRIPVEISANPLTLQGKPVILSVVRDISERKLAEQKLRMLSMVVEGTENSVVITNAQGVIEYVNPAFTRVSGYQADEVVGKTPSVVKSGMTTPETYQALWETLQAGKEWRGDFLNRRKNGELFWESEVISILRDDKGKTTHFVAIKEDITARKLQEERLRLWQRAIESSFNAIVITDASLPHNPLIYVNAAFERITGYSKDEALGRNCNFLQNEDRDQPDIQDLRCAIRDKREGRAVLRNYRKDGSLFWNELLIAPVRDEQGRVTHFIGVQNDISERVHYEAQLEYQATHDALTGLANRNLLGDRLEQAIVFAHRAERLVAVMLLDIDRFKLVNDTLGHACGDAMIQRVGKRLASCVRPGDTVARLGGDEFMVVMSDMASEIDAVSLARHLLDAVAAPMNVEGRDMMVTASLGVAIYPKDGEQAADLMKNADVAMYLAKDQGRNSFQFYSPEFNARTLERLELETRLRGALDGDQLVLHYQPKVDLQSGQMFGAEALIRWRHPLLGMVSPADFIPLAEETGLIVPIGEWVIETACRQLRAWQDEGLPNMVLSVNVSARQFQQENLSRVVAQALRLNGVQAQYLDLEVTESAAMRNPDQTIAILHQLKTIGVKISLDDFGTGYSSLNYLKRFPIDTLKIDQSFIRDITTDPDVAAIALSVTSLAHSLKHRVIAEGVETEAQLNFLRRHRCDEMQGYYFSRPVPIAEFTALIREGRKLDVHSTESAEKRRTLLLVDDESFILSSLLRVFRGQGYHILKATSAAEGLELLALNEVHVIMSDQRMPNMNGTEFLSRVKDMYPGTIRIVLSGYADLASVTDAVNQGAIFRFLSKPWDDDQLRKQVHEAFVVYEAKLDERQKQSRTLNKGDE